MAMSSGGAEGEPMMDINTTPLIDVMLVLLIMFIITIPVQTHAVKLDLPATDQYAAAADPADQERGCDSSDRPDFVERYPGRSVHAAVVSRPVADFEPDPGTAHPPCAGCPV